MEAWKVARKRVRGHLAVQLQCELDRGRAVVSLGFKTAQDSTELKSPVTVAPKYSARMGTVALRNPLPHGQKRAL